MLYRKNALPPPPEAPYRPTTWDALDVSAQVLDWRWLSFGVISPFALIVAVWRAIDFIVAVVRLVHRF